MIRSGYDFKFCVWARFMILYFLILNFFLRSGAHSSNLASLDAKLIPEHLFYLSIDYRRKFHSSSKSTNRYNFYKVFPSSVVLIFWSLGFFTPSPFCGCIMTCVSFCSLWIQDSNAHEIEQMLKVLAPLRQQIISLLNEWEEQNDLQRFLDVIDMLLTLPSDIPLAKVSNYCLDSQSFTKVDFQFRD